MYKCHHCEASGVLKGYLKPQYKPIKVYRRPTPKPMLKVSEKALKYFESRKISRRTIEKLGITEGKVFMPQDGKDMNTIQFNYFLEGELINVKYRTGNKHFMLEKDCELIPYNIDSICGKDECIITEGEMDALSFIECGFDSVVSVPNGASSNLSYLDDFIDGWFDDKQTIYIASDTDTKGLELRQELIRRFGAERCRIVTYGEGCKDANEHLIKYGNSSLCDRIKQAKDIKIEGVFELEDYDGQGFALVKLQGALADGGQFLPAEGELHLHVLGRQNGLAGENLLGPLVKVDAGGVEILHCFTHVPLLLSNVIARVAGVGERITHQIEGNGNDRHDGGGENQQVGIVQEIAAGIAQQNAQDGVEMSIRPR